jgi:dienelactone hydrolase
MAMMAVTAWGLASLTSAKGAETFPGVDALPAHSEMPDPLTMMNGEKIATKEDWFAKRVPELRALIRHYMYGVPPPPAPITATLEREDKQCLGGKATKKEIAIRFGPEGTPVLHLLLILPNGVIGPAPCFVGPNFCGNHTVLNDPTIALPAVWMPESCPACKGNFAADEGRGKQVDVWNAELIVSRGYALATYYCGDLDPDKNDFTDGVHAAFLKPGEVRSNQSWGTVAAWAYGMQRAVDYLVTDERVDKSKIIAVGHSRLGKTAILAAAYDERIAMAIPLQAGCGGTAPSRGKIGEPVERINTVFPHWFCDEFKRFNKATEKLPFDQNCLLALIAPRPVLFSNATEDTWANPAGQFEVLQSADAVYKLLGTDGLKAQAMPAEGTLVDSTLGYFIRPGKHSMSRVDWEAFLDFADKHFGKPKMGALRENPAPDAGAFARSGQMPRRRYFE